MALQLFKISDTTVSSPVASVEFTSIPQGYTDLVLKVSTRSSTSNFDYYLRFNSVSTNYSDRWLYGTGSGIASITNSGIYIEGNRGTWTANTFSSTEVYVPNYTSANYKSVSVDTVTENNAQDATMLITAGLWSNTAAITSIAVFPGAGNIDTNSTFTLYGVL
jgi:hypothetical protein